VCAVATSPSVLMWAIWASYARESCERRKKEAGSWQCRRQTKFGARAQSPHARESLGGKEHAGINSAAAFRPAPWTLGVPSRSRPIEQRHGGAGPWTGCGAGQRGREQQIRLALPFSPWPASRCTSLITQPGRAATSTTDRHRNAETRGSIHIQLSRDPADALTTSTTLVAMAQGELQSNIGLVHFPIPTQNISSSTHHIKSFDGCMEH
jgi:hypothetical protein